MKTIEVASAVIFDADRRVLIALRRKDDAFGHTWEFPGGKIDDDESQTFGLCREIREELGVTINVFPRPMITCAFGPPLTKQTAYNVSLYACQIAPHEPAPQCIECEEIQWVEWDRIPKPCMPAISVWQSYVERIGGIALMEQGLFVEQR